ncbi:Hint domain-containing protein [Roseobacter ponti]|uniref:Hedgehog/Intein (Hint) domain-containing protein n=1 Tax=Roseobacter ponti TaxID=1891787 RepID=A0A858SVH1_9RHOB|nr:Hint domain-containing protein [Roseobacter ponti]QJF50876.1 hypothetical protein G3256_06740 [Roseobacter ponti]
MGQTYDIDVLDGADFIAVAGVNEGDALGAVADLLPDDCYALTLGATARSIGLAGTAPDHLQIIRGEGYGMRLRTSGAVTLMTSTNDLCELIVLTGADVAGTTRATLFTASSPLAAGVTWRIVAVNRTASLAPFLTTRTPSFAAGTRVIMATGRLCAVENLRAGDRILTRDSGPQTVRHISHRVSPATGRDTAVRIAPGVLNNPRPLTLSAANRLVLNGGGETVSAGTLVDGKTVTAHHGGYVEYLTLHFDDDETVYAEGVSAATYPCRGAA